MHTIPVAINTHMVTQNLHFSVFSLLAGLIYKLKDWDHPRILCISWESWDTQTRIKLVYVLGLS